MWSPSKKNPKIEEKMSTRIPFSKVKKLVLQTLDDNEERMMIRSFVTYLILLLLSSLPICFQLLRVGHFFDTSSKVEKKSKARQKAYQDFLKTHVGHD
jgi:hypothetical protein